MKLDSNKHYRMPVHLGPMFDYRDVPRLSYSEVDVLAYQYLTQPEAIEALLPDCYQMAKEPLVTVFFSWYSGLDFMARGEYRTATFQVAARFDGERDHVDGDLIIVMFEDDTWPILGGREDLGVPKLHANISALRGLEDGWSRVDASYLGRLLFSMDISRLRLQSGVVRGVASRRINARPWLGYKYVPSLEGPPDADYPTITKNDVKPANVWFAKSAEVRFGDAGEEDIGQVRTLMDHLETLSVVKPVQTLRFKGSAVLRYDLSRRLR